jgi:hypothetical protein
MEPAASHLQRFLGVATGIHNKQTAEQLHAVENSWNKSRFHCLALLSLLLLLCYN